MTTLTAMVRAVVAPPCVSAKCRTLLDLALGVYPKDRPQAVGRVRDVRLDLQSILSSSAIDDSVLRTPAIRWLRLHSRPPLVTSSEWSAWSSSSGERIWLFSSSTCFMIDVRIPRAFASHGRTWAFLWRMQASQGRELVVALARTVRRPDKVDDHHDHVVRPKRLTSCLHSPYESIPTQIIAEVMWLTKVARLPPFFSHLVGLNPRRTRILLGPSGSMRDS